MAAFGKEIVIASSSADRVADQFLTGDVTLGCIDDVEPGVESTIQRFAHRGESCSLIADLRAAEAENAHIYIGFAKPALFHFFT